MNNTTIAKLLNINSNEFATFDNKTLGFRGDSKDDLSGAIRSMFGVDDKKVNIYTFDKLKTEFNKVINIFALNGTRNLSNENAKFSMFDYTDFTSVIYSNEMSRTLSFINKMIFNYDFSQDEMLYDWNKISYTMNATNSVMTVKISLENEYNEKINYTITCEAK